MDSAAERCLSVCLSVMLFVWYTVKMAKRIKITCDFWRLTRGILETVQDGDTVSVYINMHTLIILIVTLDSLNNYCISHLINNSCDILNCFDQIFYIIMHRVSEKKRAKLFSLQLRQTSIKSDNFWHKDGKLSKNIWGALIFHLT